MIVDKVGDGLRATHMLNVHIVTCLACTRYDTGNVRSNKCVAYQQAAEVSLQDVLHT